MINCAEGVSIQNGIHQAILGDVIAAFRGKSAAELSKAEELIRAHLASGNTVDGEYWGGVLQKLRTAKAQERVMEIFSSVVQKHGLNPKNIQTEIELSNTAPAPSAAGSAASEAKPASRDSALGYTEQELYAIEADKPMQEGEEEFNQDIPIKQNPEPWHATTKPRKPKFFNRVLAGYDWNRYNLVHYDEDNPPPKTVEGYKFNIFYPGISFVQGDTYSSTRLGQSYRNAEV